MRKCPYCDIDTEYYRMAKSGRVDYRCPKCHRIMNCFTDTKLRDSKLENDTIQSLRILLETGLSVSKIAHKLKIARPTIYRYMKIWNFPVRQYAATPRKPKGGTSH